MNGIIKVGILLLIFVIFVYMYSFRKIKINKEKTNNMNSVRDFYNSYQHVMSGKERPNNEKMHQSENDYYQRYVTKYNSSEDYREK